MKRFLPKREKQAAAAMTASPMRKVTNPMKVKNPLKMTNPMFLDGAASDEEGETAPEVEAPAVRAPGPFTTTETDLERVPLSAPPPIAGDDVRVVEFARGSKTMLSGALLKLGGSNVRSGKWQRRFFMLSANSLSWRNTKKMAVSIPLDKMDIIRAARGADEAKGQDPACAFIIHTVEHKGNKLYTLCAASADERRKWLMALAEVRKDMLFAFSAMGPSAYWLLQLLEDEKYLAAKEELSAVTALDLHSMITDGPEENEDGSFTTEIQLPSGHITEATMPQADVSRAPRGATSDWAQQLCRSWLPSYINSTDVVLHSELDPDNSIEEHESFVHHYAVLDYDAVISGKIGEVNFFLSVPKHEPVCDLAESLRNHCSDYNVDPRDVFVWISEFSMCEMDVTAGFEFTVVKKMINRCRNTVAVLEPWTDPRWAKSVWCIFHCVESAQVGAQFTAAQTTEEKSSLLAALRADAPDATGFHETMTILNNLDVGAVVPTNPDKSTRLCMKAMTQGGSVGEAAINDTTKKRMWEWLALVARNAVEEARNIRGQQRTRHQGSLLKLGGAGAEKTKWQKRDFQLTATTFSWKTRFIQESTRKKTIRTTEIPLTQIESVRAAQTEDEAKGKLINTVFIIHSVADGYKHGKDYVLAAESPEECASWLADLTAMLDGNADDNRDRDDFLMMLAYAKLQRQTGDKTGGIATCAEAMLHAVGVEVILFGDGSPTGEFRPVKDGQLGPEDDVVLGLRYQLAMTGPDMKAIGTIRQLMEIHQRIHGPRHEAYLELRACLADLLRKSSSDPKSAAVIEATAIFQEVIPVLESALGANHIDTLKAKGNYAHLLSAVHKDNEQARVMRAAVVQGEVDTLGPYHPDTLISRANLAVTLKRLGKVKAAIKEHETVIEGRAASLGQHHEHTVQAKLNLAKLLYKRDIEEAVGLLHECLQSREANPTLLGTEAISVASRLLPNWMHLVKTHRGSTDASSSSSEEDESAEESEAPEIVRSQADDPLLAMIDAGIAHGEKSRKEKSKKRRGGRTQA